MVDVRGGGVLLLLCGLVQINPVWQYGPFEPWIGTNGAQPDWYLGWLIVAQRLMPPLEVHLFGYTLVAQPVLRRAEPVLPVLEHAPEGKR